VNEEFENNHPLTFLFVHAHFILISNSGSFWPGTRRKESLLQRHCCTLSSLLSILTQHRMIILRSNHKNWIQEWISILVSWSAPLSLQQSKAFLILFTHILVPEL